MSHDPYPKTSQKLELKIIREICRAHSERRYGEKLYVWG